MAKEILLHLFLTGSLLAAAPLFGQTTINGPADVTGNLDVKGNYFSFGVPTIDGTTPDYSAPGAALNYTESWAPAQEEISHWLLTNSAVYVDENGDYDINGNIYNISAGNFWYNNQGTSLYDAVNSQTISLPGNFDLYAYQVVTSYQPPSLISADLDWVLRVPNSLWRWSYAQGGATHEMMTLGSSGLTLSVPANFDNQTHFNGHTVFEAPVSFGDSFLGFGNNYRLPLQVLSDTASVVTRSTGDARYLRVVANSPLLVNSGVNISLTSGSSSLNTLAGATSAAIGQYLNAAGNQVAVGKYNVIGSSHLFVVGAGSSSLRKDALAVTSGGDTVVGGALSVSGPLSVSSATSLASLSVSGATSLASLSVAGPSTFTGNMLGQGTDNRLPNQVADADESILTRLIADTRYTDELEVLASMEAFTEQLEIDRGYLRNEATIGLVYGAAASASAHAIALGHDATATGTESSSAIGLAAVANQSGTHAVGTGAVANVPDQVVVGAFNDYGPDIEGTDERTATDAVFVVGNGESHEERSNALTVTRDGTLTTKTVRVTAGGDLPMLLEFRDHGGRGVPAP